MTLTNFGSIQMNSNTGLSGNFTLPSGGVVALVNGIGSVYVSDVPDAIRLGWTVQAGQPWPAISVKKMAPPQFVPDPNFASAVGLGVNGSWSGQGGVTFPDGTVIGIVNGVAFVPIRWVNYLLNMGWRSMDV